MRICPQDLNFSNGISTVTNLSIIISYRCTSNNLEKVQTVKVPMELSALHSESELPAHFAKQLDRICQSSTDTTVSRRDAPFGT